MCRRLDDANCFRRNDLRLGTGDGPKCDDGCHGHGEPRFDPNVYDYGHHGCLYRYRSGYRHGQFVADSHFGNGTATLFGPNGRGNCFRFNDLYNQSGSWHAGGECIFGLDNRHLYNYWHDFGLYGDPNGHDYGTNSSYSDTKPHECVMWCTEWVDSSHSDGRHGSLHL